MEDNTNKLPWFTHDHDAHEDEYIQQAIDRFGHFGYSAYFITLELIHKHGIGDRLCMKTSRYCSHMRSRKDLVKVWLTFSERLGKLSWDQSGDLLNIEIKKFRERQSKLKSNLPEPFSQPSVNLPIHKKEKEKENNKLPSGENLRKESPFQVFTKRALIEFEGLDPNNKPAINAGFRRYSRACRDIMAFAGGDPEKAFRGTLEIGKYMQSNRLTWGLDTAAKWFPEWLRGGLNGTNKATT